MRCIRLNPGSNRRKNLGDISRIRSKRTLQGLSIERQGTVGPPGNADSGEAGGIERRGKQAAACTIRIEGVDERLGGMHNLINCSCSNRIARAEGIASLSAISGTGSARRIPGMCRLIHTLNSGVQVSQSVLGLPVGGDRGLIIRLGECRAGLLVSQSGRNRRFRLLARRRYNRLV